MKNNHNEIPVSIVITVKNEEKHIRELLESIKDQEGPFEVIVVDAESKDRTLEILNSYKNTLDIKIIIKKCTRGEGRNIGVNNSKYEYILFTDGDAILEKNWVSEMRKSFRDGYDFVAGKTITIGKEKYSNFDRVEIFYKNIDVTYPSCNLAYKKKLFNDLGGFDERFITAEDIDLNYRAVDMGAKFHYNENAIVYNRSREDILSFIKQAFWNGYGRKQLTMKHGSLWKNYSINNLTSRRQISTYGIIRLIFALSGYLYAKITYRL
ncbi:MAG: glycosyltransferase [Thermoplasmata archaeon]|nr:glycosyltransferase [Thermoplasmata archaeon]